MKERDLKRFGKSKKTSCNSLENQCSSLCQKRHSSQCRGPSRGSPLSQLRTAESAPDKESSDFNIIIQTIMGKNISVKVSRKTSVKELKSKLYQSEGLAVETQNLIFKDKALSDVETISSIGLVDGSTIKLVLNMSGGPGLYIKKERSDDPILLVLCRKNEQEYMLELHMGDDKTQPILLKGNSSGSSLESIITDQNDEIDEIIEGSTEEEESIFDSTRPTSAFSTSTVYSVISKGSSKIISRPSSSNSLSSASSSILEEFITAQATSSSFLPGRPATAISIMRLPITSPLILLPTKTRPASAIVSSTDESVDKNIDGCISDKKTSIENCKVVDQTANAHDCHDKIKEFISESPQSICSLCKKKLSFSFKCKCGKIFCPLHRYSDRHSCTFDYVEEHKKILREQMPMVNGEKVIKLN